MLFDTWGKKKKNSVARKVILRTGQLGEGRGVAVAH